MNGFAALDNSPCLRYVVVKATAGFAVCRLVLNLLLFYSCLDFTQNWGETRNKSFISIGELNMDVSTIVNIILCVLSFILAAISVVTVVITLRQNNKMIEESTRPFISVYTDEINAGNPFFYLVIKNFGKSTAYITKFEYDFDFNGCYKIRNDRDYLQQLNNAVLAPGQSRICTLDYQRIDRAVTFTLEYHSGAKRHIQMNLQLT